MKKLLLITCLLSTIYTQAQDYWTEYATSQPEANTGMTSISIVDDNVTWLNMSCGTIGCTPIRKNATVDWSKRDNVRAQLRLTVKKILMCYGYPPDLAKMEADRVIAQSESLADVFL